MALPWVLTTPQSEVFLSRARYLVLVAGRRFGKTVLAITWLITEVLRRPPGSLAYYVAPYRTMVKSIAWDLLLKATKDLRVDKDKSELSVTLPGHRRIVLRGADDPEKLEGVGLVAVVLDEFGRMKLDAWQKSIRPALSDSAGRALFCGKPRGHNHLKDFYERGHQRTRFPLWRTWLFRTVDGGHVPTEDLSEAKSTLPEKVYRQEYEATFETLAGRVWDGFTRRLHVVSHQVLESRYCQGGRWLFKRRCLAIDWGFTDPGVFLVIGETGTGQLVVIREEYRSGVLVDDTGWVGLAKILRLEYGLTDAVADPSEPAYVKSLRLGLAGHPVVYNAKNEIHGGILAVAKALLPRPDGEPGLLISDRCPNLIREIECYVYREIGGVSTEDPIDKDNHTCDALRYGVMHLS